MSISDFNKIKKLDVVGVSGAPTISRALCLKITSGDDSTTGTGEIVLDWANIASKADIAIYDEKNKLLGYYFESFDETDEKAVIWVFRDWVQDGSTQLQIAYGDGPSDQSVSASTVFSKESDLEAAYLFNETSGDLIDVSGNGNNGTVHGATQGEEGVVGKAYEFNGDGDYVEVPDDDSLEGMSELLVRGWMYFDSDLHGSYATAFRTILSKGDHPNQDYGLFASDSDNYDFIWIVNSAEVRLEATGGESLVKDRWQEIEAYVDSEKSYIKVDREIVATGGGISSVDTSSKELSIGFDKDTYEDRYFPGRLDDIRIYSSAPTEEESTALYDATKSSPDFFSQQAAEETGTTVIEDISLDLSAFYQSRADLAAYLSATDGNVLEDLQTFLKTYGRSIEDLSAELAAYFQDRQDLAAHLKTLATGRQDLAAVLRALGMGREDLGVNAKTLAWTGRDFVMALSAVRPLVFHDLAMALLATDGTIMNDLTMSLAAIKKAPQYKSVVAQRLRSVISEVS